MKIHKEILWTALCGSSFGVALIALFWTIGCMALNLWWIASISYIMTVVLVLVGLAAHRREKQTLEPQNEQYDDTR